MNKLKSKSIKTTLVVSILFLIVAFVMIGVCTPTMLNLIKGPVAWESVDFSNEEDLDGTYVKGTLYFIYDPYAEETTDGRTTAYEYVIDANDIYYMGLRVNSADFEEAEALLQASYNYMDELDDGTELIKYQYEVTGTIKEMPDDSSSLYNSYFFDCGFTSSERSMYCLPYYLEVNSIGDHSTFSLVFLIGIGLLLIGFAVFILVKAATGKYQKSIHQYIAASANPEAAKEKVEVFLANAPSLHGLQYDSCFLCGQNGATTIFGETDKLAWAYKHTVNHKRYFITVSKTHSVMLHFTNGTNMQFTVKKEAHADELLGMLTQLAPKAIIGYSDQLNAMYHKDLRGFLNLRYYAPQETDTVEASTDSLEAASAESTDY